MKATGTHATWMPLTMLLAFIVVTQPARLKADCDYTVPALYPGKVCGTTERGRKCSLSMIWHPDAFYSDNLNDFDRLFVFPHELFHAVQFNYMPLRTTWCREDTTTASRGPGGWLVEGMAEAVALDWADTKGYSSRPAPGEDWRMDGFRDYNYPLHKPKDDLDYYASSSFWRYLNHQCPDYLIFKAILEGEPATVDQCREKKARFPIKTGVYWERDQKNFWMLNADNGFFDLYNTTPFEEAVSSAAAFYDSYGFSQPCLAIEVAPDNSREGIAAHFQVIDKNAGTVKKCEEEDKSESKDESPAPPPIKPGSHRVWLDRVDWVLSRYVGVRCAPGHPDQLRGSYCDSYYSGKPGGLAVAYLAFINERTEDVLNGTIPVKGKKREEAIFGNDCIPPKDGEFELSIKELASVCVRLDSSYKADQVYHVTVEGPVQALKRLHLGWHRCPAPSLGIRREEDNPDRGRKIWLLKPMFSSREYCVSQQPDYTLVFSNVAREASKTTEIKGLMASVRLAVNAGDDN